MRMATNDEAMIRQLINELVDAWNRGDSEAYGARYLKDATFTNVNGMFHLNREEFNERHDEIFRGAMKGSTGLTARCIRRCSWCSSRKANRVPSRGRLR